MYALAAVLYEMLAGQPHLAPNAANLVTATLGQEVPPIKRFEPGGTETAWADAAQPVSGRG